MAVATTFPFSTGDTYLRDGVTPAGSWTACPRSERRFSLSFWVRYAGQFLAEHPASVCGCLRALSLRVCCLVVLTVSLPLRLTLALSRVLHGPLLGLSVASSDPCWRFGVVFRTLPSFLPAGVGTSVGCSALRSAAACALFPGVPLSGCGFWGVSWFSPLCSPGCGSASRFT